jgi:hypothetical protein
VANLGDLLSVPTFAISRLRVPSYPSGIGSRRARRQAGEDQRSQGEKTVSSFGVACDGSSVSHAITGEPWPVVVDAVAAGIELADFAEDLLLALDDHSDRRSRVSASLLH